MKHMKELLNERNKCCFLYSAHYPSCKRFKKDNVHNDVHREAETGENISSS